MVLWWSLWGSCSGWIVFVDYFCCLCDGLDVWYYFVGNLWYEIWLDYCVFYLLSVLVWIKGLGKEIKWCSLVRNVSNKFGFGWLRLICYYEDDESYNWFLFCDMWGGDINFFIGYGELIVLWGIFYSKIEVDWRSE